MARKAFILGLLVFVVTACSASAGATATLEPAEVIYEASVEPEDQFDSYEDANGRYQINYPESWFVVGAEEAAEEVYFINPSLSGAPHKAVVGIFVENSSNNIRRFAETAASEVRGQEGVADFRLSEEKVVSVNGMPGIERIVHYTLSGQTLAQRMVFLQQADNTFVLSLTVPDENLGNYTQIFDDIIRSFTVV